MCWDSKEWHENEKGVLVVAAAEEIVEVKVDLEVLAELSAELQAELETDKDVIEIQAQEAQVFEQAKVVVNLVDYSKVY